MARQVTTVAFTAALLAPTLACGGDQQQPTQPDEAEPQISAIEVTPASAELQALGSKQDFDATAFDQAGDTLAGVSVQWSISPDTVAELDDDGTATARANGTATVEAGAEGVGGSAELTVAQQVTSVAVTPDSVRLTAVGDSQQYTVDPSDANGHPVAGATARWTSGNPAVATVDSTGLAVARAEGATQISATVEGIADTAAIRIRLASDTLLRSFAGISETGHAPLPDLATGPSRVVTLTGHGLRIYEKNGTLVAERSFPDFFAPVDPAWNEGFADSKVQFDPETRRFFVVTMGHNKFSCEQPDCVSHYFMAVSKGPAPDDLSEANWHLYKFDARQDTSEPTTHFMDAPRLGFNQDAVVVVATMFQKRDPDLENYTKIRIFNKDSLVAGTANSFTDLARFEHPEREDQIEHPMQPVLHFSSTEDFYLVTPESNYRIGVWRIVDPLGTAELEVDIVAPPQVPGELSSGSRPDVPQPGDAPNLRTSGIRPIPAEAVYRDGALWLAGHFPADGGSRLTVRWTQLQIDGPPSTATYLRDATAGTDSASTFLPAISVNEEGDAVLLYARSSESEYPSLYYRILESESSEGGMSSARLLKAGKASLSGDGTGPIYYGIYFGAAVDPANQSFWLYGEYVETPERWGTWVGNVVF